MWIRVLSEWPGSPRCGTVADVPDAIAGPQVQAGFAERVVPPDVPCVVLSVLAGVAGPETAMLQPGERAIRPRGRPRRFR